MELNRCLHEDWFLLRYELRLQRAHARALRAANVFTAAELESIEQAIERIDQESLTLAGPPECDAEDLHTWVEARLTELAGDAGRRIHTARSRNDQVATLLVMFAADAAEWVAEALDPLTVVLCCRALEWSDLAFPLQTHAQFAAPGSVGAWGLRFAVGLERAGSRLREAATAWRRFCPLGSGAVAGSSIPIDRTIQARELGFEAPSRSALDSTTTRDECLELLALLAPVALQLQSLAADVIGFAGTSLMWVKYPEAFGTGSSMMPNKANPDAMELLRGTCNEILAAHGHALLLLKGLPSGYNRDLQCLKPIVRDAIGTALTMIDMTLAFVGELSWNPERLAASLGQGAIDATLRMEEKVRGGMALRDAHHATAEEVLAASLAGDSVPAAASALGPDRYVTIGSASPAEVQRVAAELIAEARERGEARPG